MMLKRPTLLLAEFQESYHMGMSAVAAPEKAPPMITTSYSKFIATKIMDSPVPKGNSIGQRRPEITSTFQRAICSEEHRPVACSSRQFPANGL